MIGEAVRVVGQKAQCFDCITHPERKKGAAKRCGCSETRLLSTQKWKSRDKKKTTLLLTVPEKGNCLHLSTGQKVLWASFESHLTWPRKTRRVLNQFPILCLLWNYTIFAGNQGYDFEDLGPKTPQNACAWGGLGFPLFWKQRWSL